MLDPDKTALSTCETPSAATPEAQVRGRYWIRTYGCQMNVHDSEIYAGQMRRLGLVAAETPEEADVVLVNTCSVREKAEDKLFSELGRLRKLKAPDRQVRGRQPVRIGVTGCIAQQRGEEIVEREATVDFVLGTRAIRALPAVLDALEQGRGAQVIVDDFIDFDASDAERQDRVKAYVTIMEGCNNYCSFCIVPSTRGLEIYRRAEDIVDEVRGLSARGYREVTLLGQNVNSWVDEDAELDFPGLLERLDDVLSASDSVDGVGRIRFLTSHPKDLSPALIDAMAERSRIAKHLHLPVQSGSDRVLRQMNRHYTRAGYLDLVERLRQRLPHVGLSTDLIVGFPGETRADFDATLDLVRTAQYDSFYSFEYSPRPDTAALMYEDSVDPGTKRRRLIELQDLQRGIQQSRNAAWIGRTVEVLVDGYSRRTANDVCGRTSSNQIVNFAGSGELIGRLIDVRITHAAARSLYGTGCGEPR